jgi:hypothetical protein
MRTSARSRRIEVRGVSPGAARSIRQCTFIFPEGLSDEITSRGLGSKASIMRFSISTSWPVISAQPAASGRGSFT